MSQSVEVVFQNISRSEAAVSHVEERYAALLERFPRIGAARLTVKLPHRHTKGAGFEVHLDVSVPGGSDVHVTTSEAARAEAGVDAVVNDAFRAASAQLETHFGKRDRVA